MFVNILSKTYLVNESAHSKDESDYNYVYIDYINLKKEWPTLDHLYKHFLMLNPRKETTSLLIPDKDYNIAVLDFCNYLGLNYDCYLKIVEHSNFCTTYSDYCNDSISKHTNIPLIDKDLFTNKKKIKKSFDMFPIEYAINCLDEQWALDKYRRLRVFGLYYRLKDIMVSLYRNNISIDKYPYLKRFCLTDASAKQLFDNNVYDEVSQAMIKDNLLNEVESKLYGTTVEYFANNTLDGGYPTMRTYKYNHLLSKYIKETGYKIS